MGVVSPLLLSAGVLLVFLGLTAPKGAQGADAPARRPLLERLPGLVETDGVRPREFLLMSAGAGALAALASQAAFAWPVVTVAAGAVGLLLPAWYLRQRHERRRLAVAEAVGEAVEFLRDGVRSGLGLEDGLRALARGGPEALRPALVQAERDMPLAGFERALRAAGARVADPVFDTLVLALVTTYHTGGQHLATVLDGLGRAVRAVVQTRREVRARQAEHVLSARIVAALPLVLIIVIRATNPAYLRAFGSPGGQAVLAACLVSVVVGYAAMLRAAALPAERRVLR